MKVDFNNLRKKALYAYDHLANELNSALKAGHLDELVADDIQAPMDDLRMLLFSIACCYTEGDDSVKDVSEEVGKIAYFNYDEDE